MYKVIAFFLLLGLVGCAVQPVIERDVTWHPERDVSGLMQQVVINMNRYPDGALRTVFVDGVGAYQRQPVEWSITWFSASGERIPGVSNRFRRATLNPGIPFRFEAPAPVKYAARAQIHVRRSPNSSYQEINNETDR